MALLCFNSFTPLFSSVSVSSGTMMAVVPRVHVKLIDMPSKCLSGIRISTPFPLKRTDTFIARAAASGDDGGSTAEGEKEVVSVDKLPLESKLKEREEQKLRMKLAKKIRLRRKRLVRKRHLRKKGRWPPSKMKKLKNV